MVQKLSTPTSANGRMGWELLSRLLGTKQPQNASQNKKPYDRSVRESKLEVGDRAPVRKVGLKGKTLAVKW